MSPRNSFSKTPFQWYLMTCKLAITYQKQSISAVDIIHYILYVWSCLKIWSFAQTVIEFINDNVSIDPKVVLFGLHKIISQ